MILNLIDIGCIMTASREFVGVFCLPSNSHCFVKRPDSLDKNQANARQWLFVSMKIFREWRSKVYHANAHDSFYESDEWRKLRREIFYRDHYHCLRCDKRFKTEDLNAHHMTPREEGGCDDPINLVSLCNTCHDFVEINNLRTQAAIIGSFENQTEVVEKEIRRQDKIIDDGRPEWHKYVYGGVKRRRV